MAARIENHAEPIPGYRLIERLGGGGFGEVWKAEAPGGLHKAIKFVFGDLKAAGDENHRAEQELKALSRVKTVRHPYILNLERYDIIDGQLIIVMELADRNLWDRFKECRSQGLPGIPRDELLVYMQESAEALDLMNNQYDLQHLDIKPQNLFLVYQHVKVADFGLVKDLEGDIASVTGGVTPVYAAPEIFDGKVSRFSDQYSLAIVYQELLTGQRPFTGTNVRQLILQHLQSPPNLTPLPTAEQLIIGQALSKDPENRFPTCMDLVLALKRAGQAPSSAPRKPSAPTNPPPLAVPSPSAPTSPAHGPIDDREDTPVGSCTQSAATASLRPRQHDSSGGTTHSLKAFEGAILRPVAPERRAAPAEVKGDGCLFPALVVAIGQTGLIAMQQLNHVLHEQFGTLDAVPNIRLLLLDTDSDVVRVATRGGPGTAIDAGDVVLAPLNRPSYYLKARDGKAPIDPWLNPRMIYRIPRSQVTTGVRALGRLAFVDNYRAIMRRLQAELEAVLEPAALQSASRATRLGVRTNRPRVYLLTSLAGGTGSGMFLDLAYNLKALLRQAGYEQPDVVGLLLLPAIDRARTRVMPLGNAYAALTELSHYATPGITFSARYHERESPIQDENPPFSRCILLPMPDEADEIASRELAETTGRWLYRDLCSPLGRAADLARAGVESPPWASRGLFYQTFGLFQLSWPRRALCQSVARRLCARLVQRWMTKDSKPIREPVQEWINEQWTSLELGADVFIARLREECNQALGQSPEAMFQGLLDPLIRKLTEPAVSPSSRRGPVIPEVTAEELTELLAQFEALIGKPQEDTINEVHGQVLEALKEASHRLTSRWAQRLAELPVRLIEEPSYRLAGAEEAIRLLVARIEQVLQHYEPLVKDLTTKANESFARLVALVVPLEKGKKKPPPDPADAVELLRAYPKWRHQSLILQHVSASFVALRGHLSDELREVNFCRVRLGELVHQFEAAAASDAAVPPAAGKLLFPDCCRDLADAIDRFLGGFGPEALVDLDGRMETMLRQKFKALVEVCLSNAPNVARNVEFAMLETAEAFVAEQLPDTDVAELFLQQNPDEIQSGAEVAGYYDEANPELSTVRDGQAAEFCVLAVPASPAGEQFHHLAKHALPEVELLQAAIPDDVLLFREKTNLALADLDLLGPAGQDAYRQMSSAENFTPHTRVDVEFGTR